LCCEGFFCLSTSSPSLCFPSAQPQCDKAPVAVRSRHAPFLVSRPCCRRCACRTVALDRNSAACLLARSHTCPNAVAAENDLPRFIVVCEAGQIVSLGGEVQPRCRCVSRKDCRGCRNVHSSRAGARAHTAIFRFLPSPFTYLCKVQ